MVQTHSRLSAIMGEKRLKISTIARDTGISRATLTSLYYDRNSAVSLQTLGKLCAYLHCEVGDLISYAQPKEETPRNARCRVCVPLQKPWKKSAPQTPTPH